MSQHTHLHVVVTRDDGKVFDVDTQSREGQAKLAVIGLVAVTHVDTYDCAIRHGSQPDHVCPLVYASAIDQGGDEYILRRYLYAGITVEQALADAYRHGLEDGETRCQHAYDCCAQWYHDAPTVRQVGERILISQAWSRNV